jgi:transposase
MPKAYSEDLRGRVLEAREKGISRAQVSRMFRVSTDAILRWERIKATEGRSHALRRGGDKRSMKLEAHAGKLLGWLAEKPDLTLAELQSNLKAEGQSFGITTIWRCLKRHDLSSKKTVASGRAKA